jgi:hypothetical protein
MMVTVNMMVNTVHLDRDRGPRLKPRVLRPAVSRQQDSDENGQER